MAHFARIEDGIVREIIVVSNDAIDGGAFPASEPLGQAMLADSGFSGEWLQCSYNGTFRGAYPGVGWTYDKQADQFVFPSPPNDPAV